MVFLQVDQKVDEMAVLTVELLADGMAALLVDTSVD